MPIGLLEFMIVCRKMDLLIKWPLDFQEPFAAVVRLVMSLRARAGESARQVEGLFESLLAESFG
jgi:hypothetical protein